jgi:hypothetical protein
MPNERNQGLLIGGLFLSGQMPDAFKNRMRSGGRARRFVIACMTGLKLTMTPALFVGFLYPIRAVNLHASFLLIFHIVCNSSNSGRFLQREHIHVISNSSGRGLPQNTHRASRIGVGKETRRRFALESGCFQATSS